MGLTIVRTLHQDHHRFLCHRRHHYMMMTSVQHVDLLLESLDSEWSQRSPTSASQISGSEPDKRYLPLSGSEPGKRYHEISGSEPDIRYLR